MSICYDVTMIQHTYKIYQNNIMWCGTDSSSYLYHGTIKWAVFCSKMALSAARFSKFHGISLCSQLYMELSYYKFNLVQQNIGEYVCNTESTLSFSILSMMQIKLNFMPCHWFCGAVELFIVKFHFDDNDKYYVPCARTARF